MADIKTHWKKLSNPDYIGAYAFQPGEEKTLTIKSVGLEVVTGPDGRKEECTVCHFEEPEKPLILNRTNSKTIQKLYQTPYIEDWVGKRVTLVVETVSAFGERVEAVRIKKKRPVDNSTPCTECGQIIQRSGNFSADQIIRSAMSRFNRAVCMSCAVSLRKAAEADETSNNPDLSQEEAADDHAD